MSNNVLSFEVTLGGQSGDMLRARYEDRPLKIGLLTIGYFEYWRMYKGLRESVVADMGVVADRIGSNHDLVYSGLVDTLDAADDAGRLFANNRIDLLVIAAGTYCPDYFAHQTLFHLSPDIPICLFASQAHAQLDYDAGYDQSLRNSGPMGLVQLSAGFRKMGKYRKYEVVVGAIHDEEAYSQIERFIRVQTCILNLKRWNIGFIGHVFRGMYDFQYDKTALQGVLGPHVIDIDMKHLHAVLDQVSESDSRVSALCDKVESNYLVVDLAPEEVRRSARLAIVLQELVKRYNLNGLALLGQHHIEKVANATVYLGLSEILASDQAIAVTEGDILGLVISKVLKDFTGHTPFYGEWEQLDASLNAVTILGHGFVDPREARSDRPIQVQPACEEWGFKGHSLGFQATYPPGPITISHIINDVNGWRLLISKGEVLDTPPLAISESSLIVRVDKPVRAYMRDLMMHGFAHHAIAASGDVTSDLQLFAEQLGIEPCHV